jgi:hypothetical protein
LDVAQSRADRCGWVMSGRGRGVRLTRSARRSSRDPLRSGGCYIRHFRCPPFGVAPFACSADDYGAEPRRQCCRLSTTRVVRLPRLNRSSTPVGTAHAVSGHVANRSFCRGDARSPHLLRRGSEPRMYAAGVSNCSLHLSICILPHSLSLSPYVC